MYRIEIATTDFVTTAAAVTGGADRIELCSAISEGGLTPSFGHIKKCREQFDLPFFQSSVREVVIFYTRKRNLN
jgi:copper homeostasis protein